MTVGKGWKEDVQRHGWTRVLLGRAAWRLEKHLGIHIYRIGERSFESYATTFECPPDIRVTLLSDEDLIAASQIPDLDLSPGFVAGAIAREDVAVGSFKNGELACYVFATTEAAPHDRDFWVRVKPPYRYTYKAFTLPAYRGQGLSSYVNNLPKRNKAFERRGCTKAIFFVAAWNLSSLKFLSKIEGAPWLGFALTAKVFGRRVALRTARVRKTGFEFIAPPDALH